MTVFLVTLVNTAPTWQDYKIEVEADSMEHALARAKIYFRATRSVSEWDLATLSLKGANPAAESIEPGSIARPTVEELETMERIDTYSPPLDA